jgi:hypothetical protein
MAAKKSHGPSSPAGSYVQRGHTITTVRETERTTKRNSRGGDPIVKTRTRTVYYVDGKPVKLNWFDKLRIRFMSTYEKQAFLAEKLLRQEKKARERTSRK